MVLERGLAVRGRVGDAAGRGVGGVGVVAATDPSAPSIASRARTLGDGSFVLAGLESREYAVAAGAPVPGFALRRGVRPSADGELLLSVRPAARIRVRVVDADGRPVDRTYVSLDRIDGGWYAQTRGWSGRTGPDGWTELSVPGGRLDLTASHADGRRGAVSVEAADGETAEVELVLDEATDRR